VTLVEGQDGRRLTLSHRANGLLYQGVEVEKSLTFKTFYYCFTLQVTYAIFHVVIR
jgi:hypothetical protein